MYSKSMGSLRITNIPPHATIGIWRAQDVTPSGKAKNSLYLNQPRTNIFDIDLDADEIIIRCRHPFYTPFQTSACITPPHTTTVCIVTSLDQELADVPEQALSDFVQALANWLKEQYGIVHADEHFIYVLEGRKQTMIRCYLHTIEGPECTLEWCDPSCFFKLKEAIDKRIAKVDTKYAARNERSH